MIRPAVRSDAVALGVIHTKSWQEGYKDDFDSEFLGGLDVAERIASFERMIGLERPVLVAEANGVVVGFSVIGPSRSAAEGWGEIYSIYVHPDHWGDGHGHRLLSAAEEALREMGFERALLWVLDTNVRARAFYERQSWSLGKPVKLEDMGGRQVTEVRYERDLQDSF